MLNAEIFTDTKLSWSDPVFFLIHIFWLSLITPRKCSETTHRIFQAHARRLRSLSGNFFLLFISFIASICIIQLLRVSIPFITVIYTVILKMRLFYIVIWTPKIHFKMLLHFWYGSPRYMLTIKSSVHTASSEVFIKWWLIIKNIHLDHTVQECYEKSARNTAPHTFCVFCILLC